ncbi:MULTISPECIES: hypothetical protein [unclassified Sphingobacterium]|uniref:hypothetical protein n=1 Tax=unclassified Sphingobacterium TaxID=2609468 RepID=UPI0025DD7660|nr:MULTISPECIES: hypothetical protein [unclassified Sphingobacterium]
MHNIRFIILLLCIGMTTVSKAQVYNDVARYAIYGIPQYGVKIQTNIPFTLSADMPTINLIGYSYGAKAPMNLQINFYIWHDNNVLYFYQPVISSSGAYTPKILLANEGGKVVIFIDDKVYFQRFYVNAFSGYNQPSYYQGWTIIDAPLTGTDIAEISYTNRFKGDIYLSGDGIWNSQGNVGIGTISPQEKLSVNGKIRAHEVKVETANWPDYVFAKDYKLMELDELAAHIREKGHLPNIPKAEEIEKNGVALGEMNRTLVEKIEELTLYLIKYAEEVKELKKEIQELKK